MLLREPLWVFHQCFFRFFHVNIFWVFSLLIAFAHFTLPSNVLMLPTFFAVTSFLFCCTASATDLRERFLLSDISYLTLLPNIWHNLLLSRLPWGWQLHLEGCRVSQWGSKHRHCPYVCLSHTVLGNYTIKRELYSNFSKYVEKLLMGKSVINFKHFI